MNTNVIHIDPAAIAEARSIVMRERRMALSEREWRHRLKGYGYALTDTARGRLITSLPHGTVIGPL
ncbi:hypothetical protein SAMN05216257_10162 [Meinhardsimonia xiamenensis]|jgi:hypothetical protein|uniref:Uncharacterized protein n=1 Tax=Meinhardsimonia xiamenensis TaxID=990712 RepID=A0A1G8XU97_9RHOB|nr:hypothetical protein [Meinhardsimonia xiamenensis]PRX37044.1 hypothetical protein LV81_00818 [Meinhardsimonia xiamenensis]SDJ94026.1 hypothetical protein SAMN05216257_10162 [Meinhardsimonia xiamenensis]